MHVFGHMTEQFFSDCDSVAQMQRTKASSSADAPDTKKRKVMYSTYQKWRREFDCECKTATWLGCETEMSGGNDLLSAWTVVCARSTRTEFRAEETTVRDGSREQIHFVPATFVTTPIAISTSMRFPYSCMRKQLLEERAVALMHPLLQP